MPTEQSKNRQKLIAALRSGKYQQTTRLLRKEDNFCCLGVACDLSGLGKWNYHPYGPVTYLEEWQLLPETVRSYYGFPINYGLDVYSLEIEDGSDDGNRTLYGLAHLNDSGFTFNQIADIIEYYFWDEDHE